jgi:hypothetical protein
MTPIEASKTVRGRQLLNELLAFYDSMRRQRDSGVGGLDMNIPTRYTKWKLGYGPGSAEDFVEEEKILNYFDPTRRNTPRKERHTKKLKKKKAAIFIPERCEVVGDKHGMQLCLLLW